MPNVDFYIDTDQAKIYSADFSCDFKDAN